MSSDDRDELGIGPGGLDAVADVVVAGALGMAPGWAASVLGPLVHSVRERADDRTTTYLERAQRRSGMTPTDFAARLGESYLYQESLYVGLQAVIWTGQDRKRHRAAYVLGDAIAGKYEPDASLMLMRTVAALDEEHWALLGVLVRLDRDRLARKVNGKTVGLILSSSVRYALLSVHGEGIAARRMPLLNGLVSHGIVHAEAAYDGIAYQLTDYAPMVFDYLNLEI